MADGRAAPGPEPAVDGASALRARAAGPVAGMGSPWPARRPAAPVPGPVPGDRVPAGTRPGRRPAARSIRRRAGIPTPAVPPYLRHRPGEPVAPPASGPAAPPRRREPGACSRRARFHTRIHTRSTPPVCASWYLHRRAAAPSPSVPRRDSAPAGAGASILTRSRGVASRAEWAPAGGGGSEGTSRDGAGLSLRPRWRLFAAARSRARRRSPRRAGRARHPSRR